MPARKHLIVVGAGVFGLFCARAAQDAGWRVTAIDPRPALAQRGGRCASASAAGMLGPLSETLLEPAPLDPLKLDAAMEALRLWTDIGADFFGAAFQPIGALHVGGVAQAETLTQLAHTARELDLGGKILRGGAVRAAWPGLGFRASLAVRIDGEALIAPTPALARLEKHLGAACRFGIALAGFDKTASGWRAALGNGETLDCDEALLCPGFAPELFGLATSLQVLQPAAGVMAALRAPLALKTVVRGPGFYLAPRGEGEIVLGSTMQWGVSALTPDVKELRKLAARVFEFSPAMRAAPEAARWAGVRAMSPDWAPLIGRDAQTGLLVAAGAGRNGWLYGPFAGAIISALLHDKLLPLGADRLDPQRFSFAAPPSHA
jgi:glycine oxidase